jgi:hypothetical protein
MRTSARPNQVPFPGWPLLVAVVALAHLSGCASFTNPVADGVPVHRLPPEFLGRPREDEKAIPFQLLRQKPPDVYKLGPGDIVGIYIEGILGDRTQPLPVHYGLQEGQAPSIGYPLPVRADGTLPLPLIPPVKVEGLSLAEAQEAIRKEYTETKKILKPGTERIIVTLQRPRQYHVLVVREDGGGLGAASSGVTPGNVIGSFQGGQQSTILGVSKRGTGSVLDLPAYENDVLNALARTGGLPGLDAANEVIIEHGSFTKDDWPTVMPDLEALQCGVAIDGLGGMEDKINRIPLRLRPGELIPFQPNDIILKDGDIVFIRARDTELFYTGGLLGGGEHILPRDYDLRMVEAVARVRGPLINGGLNQNNFTGQITQSGLGFPSPSLLSVLRRTTAGGQVTIKVDLNRACRDPRENILVQAGDVLILQESPGEAFSRYFSEVFTLDFLGTILRHRDAVATTELKVP